MPLRRGSPFAMLLLAVPLLAGTKQENPLPVQSSAPGNLAAGKLLVAKRGMGDPNFARTVILLTHFDANGVMGLILNRRTDAPISEVLDLKSAKDRVDPVYRGGPVHSEEVFGLLQSKTKADKAEKVFDGVYLISDKTAFDKMLAARPDASTLRVYLGYAGWTQAQLQHEVQLGAWFIFPADAATVFSPDPDAVWNQMIAKTKLELADLAPLPPRLRR